MNKENKAIVSEAIMAMETAKSSLWDLRDEIGEALEEMSYGAKESTKGEALQQEFADLEEALSLIDDVIDKANDARDH